MRERQNWLQPHVKYFTWCYSSCIFVSCVSFNVITSPSSPRLHTSECTGRMLWLREIDQMIRRVVYGRRPQRAWTLLLLHSQPWAVRTKRERGEDKAKDTSNDNSLTTRLMAQHKKVWSSAHLETPPSPPPGRNLCKSKSCRFQWPINE